MAFDPDSLPKSYTYDVNGNISTVTAIEQGAIVRVKTYTYTKINTVWMVLTESAWINVTEGWRG